MDIRTRVDLTLGVALALVCTTCGLVDRDGGLMYYGAAFLLLSMILAVGATLLPPTAPATPPQTTQGPERDPASNLFILLN